MPFEVLAVLVPALRKINEARRRHGEPSRDVQIASAAELLQAALAEFRDLGGDATPAIESFLASTIGRPDLRLAAYGSLAPGQSNHDQVASLAGSWEDGAVRGRLHRIGWGQAIGFPGLTWDPRAAELPVKLFTSPELPAQWRRLDDFEGSDYRRILVPVETRHGMVVANIYEPAAPS